MRSKKMNVILYGKETEAIVSAVQAAGFLIVERDPDFVISYGGDGTLIHSEYSHPGIPKIVLKNNQICKRCSDLSNAEVLRLVASGAYTIEKLIKLEVEVAGRTLTAINDITVHNQDPRHAIRYSLAVNDRPIGQTIIGDGVVVATPFGSTAYYRSITDSYFEVDIGLAFNNSTEQSDHIVLRDDSTITVILSSGTTVIYADNQDDALTVGPDERIVIRKAATQCLLVVPKQ